MTLVDSSGWIQYLTDGPLADAYAAYLSADGILVPTIVLYEVCKFTRRTVSADASVIVAARLNEGQVVPLDEKIAMDAVEMSLQHKLAMADAVVYATACCYNALLVTSDADFQDVPEVHYIRLPEA